MKLKTNRKTRRRRSNGKTRKSRRRGGGKDDILIEYTPILSPIFHNFLEKKKYDTRNTPPIDEKQIMDDTINRYGNKLSRTYPLINVSNPILGRTYVADDFLGFILSGYYDENDNTKKSTLPEQLFNLNQGTGILPQTEVRQVTLKVKRN